MNDSLSCITTLFGCQDGAFCKCCNRCPGDRVLAVGLGGVLGNLCALVEVRSVLSDQSMLVNLVAVLVTANLDPNVAAFHTVSTVGRRDFIQRKCHALESTTPMLERATVRELANRQVEWMVMHMWRAGIAIAMIRCEDHVRSHGRSAGTNDPVLAICLFAPAGDDRAALVKKCCVLMHQAVGMELVAIGVTANQDADVSFRAIAHVCAVGAIGNFSKPNHHEAVSTISIDQ